MSIEPTQNEREDATVSPAGELRVRWSEDAVRQLIAIASRALVYPHVARLKARQEAQRAEEAFYLSNIPEGMRDLPRYTHAVACSHGEAIARDLLTAARKSGWDTEQAFELFAVALKPARRAFTPQPKRLRQSTRRRKRRARTFLDGKRETWRKRGGRR